jgi:tRNA dimethylallyltransferase
MNSKKILILGVTTSGKGRMAFDLAKNMGAEIISIDSMKVYRRMDIGTAKPPKEARQRIRYHLIDVVEPSESFSVGTFLKMAYDTIEQLTSRNIPIIAVGGTALYIKALLYGLFEGPAADQQLRDKLKKRAETKGLISLYQELTKVDPVLAERISSNDAKRIIRALEVYQLTGKPISSFQKQWLTEDRGRRTEDRRQIENDRRGTLYLAPQFIGGVSGAKEHNWAIIGLRREKAEENKRINTRVKKMIDDGLVDEVKSLLGEEKPMSPQAQSAIGYAEIIDYLNGRYNLEETVELIKRNTRRFAKHQRTWFKTFRNVNWIDIKPDESAEQILSKVTTLVEAL